jgi:hypothetical protein
MPAGTDIQVLGIKDTLKTLNKLAPELRKGFNRDYKRIVQPVVNAAKASTPIDAPLSGMARNFKRLGKWDGSKVQKGIASKIDTRKMRSKDAAILGNLETVGALYVISKTGYGSMFDMSGKRNSASNFVQALQGRWGSASRSMWPAWESNRDLVESAVVDLVNNVEKITAIEMAKF